jgi:hypothetical protein
MVGQLNLERPLDQGGAGGYDLWKGVLPDLMFPTDRSWLLSTLGNDHRTCIRRSKELVDAFLGHPDLRHRVRQVDPSVEDATPQGHTAI